MKHPALLQFRGNISKVMNHINKLENVEIEENRYGIDVYFEDVNTARRFLSKIKKNCKGGYQIQYQIRRAEEGEGKVVFHLFGEDKR